MRVEGMIIRKPNTERDFENPYLPCFKDLYKMVLIALASSVVDFYYDNFEIW